MFVKHGFFHIFFFTKFKHQELFLDKLTKQICHLICIRFQSENKNPRRTHYVHIMFTVRV